MTGKRPDHPDFWMIAQAIIDTDSQTRTEKDSQAIVERYVDRQSATYAAMQRALHAVGTSDLDLLAKVTSIWLDGFVAGIRFQHLKTTGAQNITDTELDT